MQINFGGVSKVISSLADDIEDCSGRTPGRPEEETEITEEAEAENASE